MQRTFEKIIEKLEKVNPVDYGSMSSYEAHSAVKDCLRDVTEIVNQVASEYGGGWIPVEERLPEIYEPVLVCNKKGSVCIRCINWISQGKVKIHCWSQNSTGIIAWQPLPEAYKNGEEREDE